MYLITINNICNANICIKHNNRLFLEKIKLTNIEISNLNYFKLIQVMCIIELSIYHINKLNDTK